MPAYYSRVRVTGTGTDEDPYRPALPISFAGDWVAAYASDNRTVICLTNQPVVFDGARDGAVLEVAELEDAATERGLDIRKIESEMALRDASHPSRGGG